MAKKSKVVIEEITETELEQKLSEYANLQNTLRQIEGELNQKITNLRDKYQDKVETLKAQSDDIFTVIQVWAERNRALFEKKRSKELHHGKIGFRTGTPKAKTKKGFTWASVLELAREFAPAFVRTKDEVDKESLIAKREEAEVAAILPRLGVEIVQDESFFIDLKEEEIIE